MTKRLTDENLESAIARANRAHELAARYDKTHFTRAVASDPILSTWVRDAYLGLAELRELRARTFPLEIPPDDYLPNASAAEMRLVLWSITRALKG